jgi:hypothetical protein
MKHASIYFSLLFVFAFTAFAADGPKSVEGVLDGPSAVSSELQGTAFANLLADGAMPLFDESFMAASEVTSPDGTAANARMTFVPLVNSSTGQRGYYMKVSVTTPEGVPLFDHQYTVHELQCNCMGAIPSSMNGSPPLKIKALAGWSDASSVLSWVKSRNWNAIRSWASSQLAKRVTLAVIADIVRWAFVSNGYWCPDLAWWVPYKYLVYLTTCARRAY